MAPRIHPLISLSETETNRARDIVRKAHLGSVLHFRVTFLQEPPKSELSKFLALEHSGRLHEVKPDKWPRRLARVHYDQLSPGSKVPKSVEVLVDLDAGCIASTEDIRVGAQPAHELQDVGAICEVSKLFKDRVAKFNLPEDFELVAEPWPYGGLDPADERDRRFMQALIFAVSTKSKNPDSNFYTYPMPIIPVVDSVTRQVIRIHELSTGGDGDPYTLPDGHFAEHKLHYQQPSEYVPELLSTSHRTDLKELNVVQPDGASFTVKDESLVEWQKWRMRVTFNPREGAVVHDAHFDGRSVLYRLSFSDMTVPYADPRPPFHRKQAFDFGDGALGDACNNLQLGCDCLGVIKYFDGVLVGADGTAKRSPNVICLHEQDNGINWKHTNWRTGRAVVTRRRELVLQFIITLANYEYIFNYIFDQAGGITVQARATGIVSSVAIDEGKKASWGNIVSPGVLAQNHQHIFCVRIDPAIDGHNNTVVQQESLPLDFDEHTNPMGNAYRVAEIPITTAGGYDANVATGRIFKVQNLDKLNPVSGKPVGYKIIPPTTQLLLAHPKSIQARRALFAQKNLWVTSYRDNELYAGGRYTLQSVDEVDGVADAAARRDDVRQKDIVVWSVFGLTHNPRVEDWPVMPVEIMQLHINPYDFFTSNPAIDVPPSKNAASRNFGSGDKNGSCCKAQEGEIQNASPHARL
ncbi:copper amine oxidase 1 [Microdochium trichocladiopsis]|uniref:Amine oxidase n=1 Tax=Microdochium trichocladiopsis TaxID=1682393 RepID=A0A9P8Y6B6_9PEZI|nr:copper amine oxidase 1 [Microdochium trichocladiopsis]KAH7029880.1 copper amine oxidase 1 [Microdochium trichocladiopsis]